MPKHGKKYNDIAKSYDLTKIYEVEEAISLVKKNAKAKFDETIEVAVRLNLDPRQSDQQIRGAVVLPNGTGVTRRVLVFAKGDKVKEAEAAGADFVGSEELDVTKAVAEVKAGKIEYRLDKAANVHARIGKASFATEKLVENYLTLVDTLIKVKPAAAKGQYIKNISVTSTMSPAVRINVLKPLGK